jgi:lysophospholipase L1-like esterase
MKKPLFALIVLLVSLLTIEGIARLLEPQSPARTMPLPIPGQPSPQTRALLQAEAEHQQLPPVALSVDEERGWGLPASSLSMEGTIPVRTNMLGLRGPEIQDKQPGEIRLFTLGDSSIYGQGVPEEAVFSSEAARILREKWQLPVTAVIGGIPGYSSDQALKLLQKLGPLVKPDRVVIGALWSDLYAGDSHFHQEKTALQQLASYRILLSLLAPLLPAQKVGYMEGRQDIGFDSGPPPRTSLKDFKKNLQQLVEETEKLGAKPVFVILPAPLDFDTVPPPASVQQYREAIKTLSEQENAPLLDGPARFAAAGGTVAHFGDQVHPNAQGHLLLGRLLADAMEAAP